MTPLGKSVKSFFAAMPYVICCQTSRAEKQRLCSIGHCNRRTWFRSRGGIERELDVPRPGHRANEGSLDAAEAENALTEFGKVCRPGEVRRVTYGMIEDYVGHLKAKGNKLPTINKKLRYLRAAFQARCPRRRPSRR